MANILSSYSTVIMADVLLDGTHRFANRDFYDASDRYYRGSLLDFPAISEELSDLYYGVEQGSAVTLSFANESGLGTDRGPYVFESLQDFHTDYTETDPNGRITVAPNQTITFAGLTENEDAWVYRDMGAGYFSRNFRIHLEVEITAAVNNTEQGTLILANSVKSYEDIDGDSESYLGVILFRDGGGNYEIWLDEVDSGARTSDSYTGAANTRYYLVVERKEGVGTYGTIYCYIYSDVGHTDLLDTLSVTLNTSKKDFRYIYGLNAHNAGDAGDTMSGIVANMYMYRERTWDGLANVQELRERWVLIRRAEDDPVDIGFLLAEDGDFLTTEDGRYFMLSEFEEPLKFQFRGKIVDYRIGDTVELTVESRDDWILDTLLPLDVVTTDEFTATAIDLGEPVNICFGKCRNVPLRNIQNDTGTNEYDYLVGYGIVQGLWVDHANGIGVKRDGVLVDTSEYTFYDGSQATYSGYAFLRFTTEQMDFSGSFHKLTADVYGLEMGGTAMQRNFATVIGNFLSNAAWGLGDNINATSFIAGAAALDTIADMYCDGAVTKQQQARDILNELLFPARATVERNADGEWEIDIDGTGASVLGLGDNDGYYNNAEIGDVSITPSNDALKTAIAQYSLNPLDEDMPFKEVDIGVHTFGVVRTYSLPFVLEDDTAEKVLSYLKNRSLYSDRRVPVSVGMEGRDLSRGDVVTLHKPTRLLSADTFKIERITRGGIGFDLECREYNASIYGDETVVAPTGPTASEITVEGPRSLVGDSQLGDGVNKSGTITLHLAPGKGDCYIKGGTVDVAAWTCEGGFILGIDDSDSDLAKFFVGSTALSFMSWDGAAMTYQIGSGDALTVKGGGDIIVESGGDIKLYSATGGASSLIEFHGDVRTYYMGIDYDLDRFCIFPDTTGTGTLYIGRNTANAPKYFDEVLIYSKSYVYITGEGTETAYIGLYGEGASAGKIRLYSSVGEVNPVGAAGATDLGTDTEYWGDINYKTLDDRGCLGYFGEGVELQNGEIVSDLEALLSIKKHLTKKTTFGLPMLDYRTLPKPIYRQAGLKQKEAGGDFYPRDENDEPYTFDGEGNKIMAADGAEISSLISIMLGAIKQLDREKKGIGN